MAWKRIGMQLFITPSYFLILKIRFLDIIDDDPNYGIPRNVEAVNAIISQHEAQMSNTNPQIQTLQEHG